MAQRLLAIFCLLAVVLLGTGAGRALHLRAHHGHGGGQTAGQSRGFEVESTGGSGLGRACAHRGCCHAAAKAPSRVADEASDARPGEPGAPAGDEPGSCGLCHFFAAAGAVLTLPVAVGTLGLDPLAPPTARPTAVASSTPVGPRRSRAPPIR